MTLTCESRNYINPGRIESFPQCGTGARLGFIYIIYILTYYTYHTYYTTLTILYVLCHTYIPYGAIIQYLLIIGTYYAILTYYTIPYALLPVKLPVLFRYAYVHAYNIYVVLLAKLRSSCHYAYRHTYHNHYTIWSNTSLYI